MKRKSVPAAMAILAAASIAPPASAATAVYAFLYSPSGALEKIKGQSSPVSQKMSGGIAKDLGRATPGVSNSYSIIAAAGGLSISNNFDTKIPSVGISHGLSFQQLTLQAQFYDNLHITGGTAGQRLIFHRQLGISGGSSLSGRNNSTDPNSGFELTTELALSVTGLADPGPYAGLDHGGPSFATAAYGRFGSGLLTALNRAPPTTVEYDMMVTVGQDNFFQAIMNLDTTVFVQNKTTTSMRQNYSINLDTGPGYFTILGNDGLDSGIRFTPNFKIKSDSGFDYMAAAGQGGSNIAAIPEPASWALMLGGFSAIGGAMRRTRKPALIGA